MRVLICYDVANTDRAGARRLRKIAAACVDHGVRVQFSVFECQLEDRNWVVLKHRLLGLYDAEQDSLRFYYLSEDDAQKTEHHGVRRPLDVAGPLLV